MATLVYCHKRLHKLYYITDLYQHRISSHKCCPLERCDCHPLTFFTCGIRFCTTVPLSNTATSIPSSSLSVYGSDWAWLTVVFEQESRVGVVSPADWLLRLKPSRFVNDICGSGSRRRCGAFVWCSAGV